VQNGIPIPLTLPTLATMPILHSVFQQEQCRNTSTLLTGWVGIDEPESEKIKFEYYPNPASSNVTIHLSGLHKGRQYQLDISDNSGKIIYTTHLQAYENIELPLEQFAKGVYFFSLNTGEHVIGKKLIIQ